MKENKKMDMFQGIVLILGLMIGISRIRRMVQRSDKRNSSQ
uniref:Uncharacterized protein n=1 Tax=Rhizophora mucronata TaxID=61149 RepID=A0A2P2NG79_RHIMU